MAMPNRIGEFVCRRAPSGYRTNHWAQILTTTPAGDRDHWLVIYQDGENDLIPVVAPPGHYEFRSAPADWHR